MAAPPKNPHGWYDDGDYVPPDAGDGGGGGGGGELADVAYSGLYEDLLNKPLHSVVASTGRYSDLIDAPWLQNGTSIYNTNVGSVHVSDTLYAESLSAPRTDIVFNKAEWNLTRGLIIHNEGSYNQEGFRIGSGLYGDPRDPDPASMGLPYGGRLFHAQPLSGVTNPSGAEFYTIFVDGQQMVVREIVDENGFTNFWNNKNIPAICTANKTDYDVLSAMGAALGLGGALAIAGFANFLKDNFTGSGGGGGGGGGGSGGDPDYTLRVYWKDLKQRPFATKTGGLMAIDGDLLVSSARRLRSVLPGAFNTDLDTTSREVNDAEANQLTFIDFDEKKFYGRRFYATENATTVSVLTGQGVGFGESETGAKDNIVFTKDFLLFKDGNFAWMFTKNGISHRNQSGVFKTVLWWDGDGQAAENYHVFAETNISQEVDDTSTSVSRTWWERFTSTRAQQGQSGFTGNSSVSQSVSPPPAATSPSTPFGQRVNNVLNNATTATARGVRNAGINTQNAVVNTTMRASQVPNAVSQTFGRWSRATNTFFNQGGYKTSLSNFRTGTKGLGRKIVNLLE